MASNHEGYSLNIDVDFSQLEKANKQTGALYEALSKVDRKISGLHMPNGLPSEINHVNAVTASYIQRLESAGKTYRANEERVKAYQDAISKLTQKGQSLREELAKIEQVSGKASNAYQHQLIRINQTATDLNKLKQAVSSTNAEMRKTNPSFLDKIKNKLEQTGTSTDKTQTKLKSLFSKGNLTTAAKTSFNYLKGGLQSAVSSAQKYQQEQQALKGKWNTLTGGSHQGSAMVKQINQIATATHHSSSAVDHLSQKFYRVKQNAGQTGKLTNSVLTLQNAYHATNGQVNSFSNALSQTMKQGNVSVQGFKTLTGIFPELRDNLQKTLKMQTNNHHLTKTQMADLVATGKVSSTTLINAIEQTAHKSKSRANDFVKTIPGMIQTVKTQIPRLSSAFEKPFTKIKNPLNKQISDWVSSKQTDKTFTRLGSTVSSGLNKAVTGVIGGKSKGSNGLTKAINGGINNLGKGLSRGFSWIADHGKDIRTFGKSIFDIAKTVGQSVWQSFSSIFINIGKAFGLIGQNADKHGGAIHAVAEGFSNLAKNKTALKAISDAIVAIYSVKATKALASPLISLAGSGYRGLKRTKYFYQGFKGVEATKDLDKIAAPAFKSGGFFRGLFSKTANGGAGKLTGLLQSVHSAGGFKEGFKNLSTAGKIGTVAAGAGVAIDAGSSFLDAFKNRHSADKRSADIGKGIGSGIGGGIGLWFGGPLGAAVGAKIGGTVGKWGGQAVNKFTKGWQSKKPPKKFWSLENLGWSAHDMVRKTGKAAGQAVNSIKKGWKAKKPPKKFWSLETLGWAGQQIWSHSVYHAAINGVTSLRKGWTAKKPPKKFWSLENLGWSTKNMFTGFMSGVKGVISWFKEQWQSLTKWFDQQKDGFNKWAGNIGDNVKSFFGAAKKGATTRKAHATGGHIGSSHGALVGEGGPELAYKVNGSHVRILGANGPEFTHVKAGERILNARDTQKVMRGGLGAGLVLNGYAAGNTKLDHTAKSTNQTWKKITSETGKQTKKTRVQSIRDYTNMRKGVNKQMDGLHDGTVSLAKSTAKGFGKAMGRMKGYAKDAMKDTIEQINRGISGIDKVLGQFGGNNSVIKPVKFATGSNGQLNNNTLAMVNDAQSGPRQEAIVKASGDIWLPRGDNRILPLQKGDAVLNGMQTQDLAHSWGLTHFAKGSGVSTSMLKKIASRGAANPAKSFSDMFTSKLRSGKVDITAGTVDLAKNSGKQFGVPWMNAMWTVIGNAIGDGAGRGGTREAFLKYAESTFSGVRYVMGAASKLASDCSGMVMQALRHYHLNIGRSTVDMQNSSGVEYLGKSLSKTVPGDLVIFGHGSGAAGHVGIIKNPQKGTMFNETPPSARVSRISDDKSMGYGYYRVKGLHDATAKSSNKKPSSALLGLAKRELGASAIKWIKDKLGDEGELGPNIGGEGVQRWAGTVKRILGMLHLSTSQGMVAKVLRQIQTESHGDPHAIQPGKDPDGDGSGPALGLMQTKRMTFNTFKRKGAGNIFNGPDNIYAALNYAKHTYGDNLSALGNGKGYANGGNPPVGENVLVGEKGPEIAQFKNPVHVYSHEQSKRMSLDNLINKSKVKMPKTGANVPNVTININGNISSERDAKKYAEIIDRKIQDLFESIGLEFGSDPSMY